MRRAQCAESTALTAVPIDQRSTSSAPAPPKSGSRGGQAMPLLARHAVGGVEPGADLGEVAAEVGEHPGILRLPRRRRRTPATPARCRAAVPRSSCPARRGSTVQAGFASLSITRRSRSRRSTVDSTTRPRRQAAGGRFGVQGERQVLERHLPVRLVVEPVEQALRPADQAGAIARGQQDRLVLPAVPGSRA